MYSIRPHSAENIDLDLPTTMYSVQPIIQQTKVNSTSTSTNETVLKEIEKRQDILIEKIEQLYNQLILYQKNQTNVLSSIPVREELVVHLSAKQPSQPILNLIEQFREKLSIRTYRHSSLLNASFNNQIQDLSSTNNQKSNRSLTIIWADGENLPFMFHSHMNINDEQSIINLLSHELTNK
jgi:hypothetical protein